MDQVVAKVPSHPIPKMTSPGELTSRIAHEIQNPLNLVNNFSDVNTGLINEMQQEMENGNLIYEKAISNDIVKMQGGDLKVNRNTTWEIAGRGSENKQY